MAAAKTNVGISYVVPAYNCAEFLPQTIQSIECGNLERDDEIIIVDDASTDETRRVMEELAAKNSQIRILQHRINKGSGAAGRNTGVEHARHDLVFTLDADNLLVPGSVRPLIEYLVAQEADVAAFEELRFFTADPSQPTHSWSYKAETTLADALAGPRWPGSDGNYLYTRDIWLRAGRCDENFGGLDAWAFGIRQLACGAKIVALPNHYYLHRYGHDSLFTRESRDGSLSIKALRALLPILDMLEPESARYLLSDEGRTSWFENLESRPLRLKNATVVGGNGTMSLHPRKKDPFIKRLRWVLAHKIAPPQ